MFGEDLSVKGVSEMLPKVCFRFVFCYGAMRPPPPLWGEEDASPHNHNQVSNRCKPSSFDFVDLSFLSLFFFLSFRNVRKKGKKGKKKDCFLCLLFLFEAIPVRNIKCQGPIKIEMWK